MQSARPSNAHGPTLSRPAEYPSAWDVEFSPAAPMSPDYKFGHQTTVLKAGSVYPPASKPLPYDISWERDVPVQLRDGVTIYLDILRPACASPSAKLPTLVAWSPYGKSLPAPNLPSGVRATDVTGVYVNEGPDVGFWAAHGYAVVHPDPRGVNKSEGNIHGWGSVDADDAYDVIEWIGTRPWSNGKVGLHGTSWLAIAQWFIAAKSPPHLRAIAPWNGMSDVYRNAFVCGGIPDGRFASEVVGTLAGSQLVERFDLMAEQSPTMNEYWEDKAANLEAIKIPAYIVTDTTTDLHRMGTFEGFRRLGSADKWLRVNNRQEWTDQYDAANQIDLLRFFDHYLKDQNNGWEKTPRVRMSILDPGGSDRINVPYTAWPIPDTQYCRLYLDGSTRTLSPTPVSSAVELTYPAKDGKVEFTYRFEKDTQITGYLKAHLWVEAKDTNDQDVFLLLEKLDAHGNLLVPAEASGKQYFPVPPPGSQGRLRVSMRALDEKLSTPFLPVQSFVKPDPVPPGKAVAIEVALLPESVQFHAGEQLRLIISSQEPLPVGGNVAGPSPMMKALPPLRTKNSGTDAVHSGGPFDSYLQIPIVS